MLSVILSIGVDGCETWSVALRKEHWLGVSENRVLRKIFAAKREDVTRYLRKLHNEELRGL
jgi:hypothetical protein